MADLKFSQFTSGAEIEPTDILVGLRDGVNTQFSSPSSPGGPFLLKSENLSDLTNSVTAIENIGLGQQGILILSDSDFAATGGTYILTNPSPIIISMTTSSPGRILQLPPQNDPTSLQASSHIELLTEAGSEDILITNAAGDALQIVSEKSAFFAIPNDRTSVSGNWVLHGEVQTINATDTGLTGAVYLSSDNLNANDNFTPVNYTPVSGSGWTTDTITGNLAGIDVALLVNSPLTTKGDIYTYSTIPDRLPVGSTDGQILQVKSSTSVGIAWSTPTYPSISGTVGKILRSDGTNNVYSTSTFSDTYATNNILYASSTNTITGLASSNTSVLNTDGSGNLQYTGYSATGGTSNFVSRDVNGNTRSNNTGSSATSIVSAGTTTNMTDASSRYQVLSGTLNQTFNLPDATTLFVGARFEFNNNSTGTLTVNDNSASLICTVPSGGSVILICIAISTSAGAWDFHYEMPSNAQYGTAGLKITGTLASGLSGTQFSVDASGNITSGTWQGSLIALTYGGTNNNLTASNGGIVWSDATKLNILSGTATANKILMSGATATPSWSTPTYPSASGSAGQILRSDGTNNVYSTSTFADTYTKNSILYGSAINTVTGLASSNTSVLNTDGSGNLQYTGYSATGGTSNFVSRDANGNMRSNNTGSSATAVVSAGGTTAMTAASSRYQVLSGTLNQIFTLPDATTLFVGARFEFNNNSTGVLTVNNNASSLVCTVPSGGSVIVICISSSTSAGAWDNHYEMPANAQYGTSGLKITGTLAAGSSGTQFAVDASGNITAGNWQGSVIGLTYGGTNASLTANNGGIVWSDSTKLNILSGTSTANQILMSGSSTTPAWSTATFASTYAVSTLLYAGSSNAVSGLATANSAQLVTGSTGIPVWSSTMTNGQMIIGSTGSTPTTATLTAGTNISITNGAGSITVSTTGPASFTWTAVSGTSQTAAVNSGYICTNVATCTVTMPATAAVGSIISVVNSGSGGVVLQAASGQNFVCNGTLGSTTGTATSQTANGSIDLICTIANSRWQIIGGSIFSLS